MNSEAYNSNPSVEIIEKLRRLVFGFWKGIKKSQETKRAPPSSVAPLTGVRN